MNTGDHIPSGFERGITLYQITGFTMRIIYNVQPAQRKTQELVGSYGTSEFGSGVPSPTPSVIIRGYFWVCGDGLLYSLQAVRRSMLDLDLNSCCPGLYPLLLAGDGPREVRDGDDEEATSQS